MPRHSQDEQPNTLDTYSKKLYGLGLQKVNFDQHISGMRALQSQRAGVSGWHTAQVEKKSIWQCFLFHIFCHPRGTESKSRGFTALFATKEFCQLAIQRTGRDDPTFIDTCFGTTLLI